MCVRCRIGTSIPCLCTLQLFVWLLCTNEISQPISTREVDCSANSHNMQGFASGDIAADAYALRLFGHAGVEMLVGQSYAKTMGLYGERVGTLSVVCADGLRAATVRSQLKQLARLLYSNPPRHGAEVAVLVLSQPELRGVWEVRGGVAPLEAFLACSVRLYFNSMCRCFGSDLVIPCAQSVARHVLMCD